MKYTLQSASLPLAADKLSMQHYTPRAWEIMMLLDKGSSGKLQKG